MAISVECEACGATFKVAETSAGKRGKCPKCGEIFTAKPVGPASSSPSALASRSQASGSSVARNLSPQSPTKKQPGPSRRHAESNSSSSIRPASSSKRASAPPPAPARAVPVGSVPTPVPVGALPGESSVGKAIVRPASGVGISVGGTSGRRAKPYRRKKGTPIILWVIIVVGGISATAGWIYVATREPEKPVVAQAPVTKTEVVSEQPASEKKAGEGAKTAIPSGAAGSKPVDAEGAAATGDRKLSVSPEAESGSEVVEDLDASLAGGGGDLGSTTKKRPTVKITTRDTTTNTSAATKVDEVAPGKSAPVTAEEITTLAEACKRNAWKADSKEQYQDLAALASGMMNYADASARDVAAGLINGPLSEVVWTTEGVSRINRNAARELDNIGAGCFVVAVVTEQVEGGALLKLISTESMIKIEMSGAQLAQMRPGINLLIIGTITPESYDLPASSNGEARRARVIDHQYRLIIRQIYDREASTIGPAGGGD